MATSDTARLPHPGDSGPLPAAGPCGEALALLSQFADNVLPAEQSRQVAAHLAGCARCAADLRALRAEQALLVEALKGVKPSDSFRRRVSLACAVQQHAERMANSLPERGWRLFRWTVGFVALAFVVALLKAYGPRWWGERPGDESLREAFTPLFVINIVTFCVACFLLLEGHIVARLECYLSGLLGGEPAKPPSRLEVVLLETVGLLGVLLTGLFSYIFLAR